MPALRLSLLVYDGGRVLLDARTRDLPGLNVAEGETREDEALLAERAPAIAGLPVRDFAFVDTVPVHRGPGRIVNLYLARAVAGDSLPTAPPEGMTWATLQDLEDSAIPGEVLATLDALIRGPVLTGMDRTELREWEG